ncbi:MAG: YdcF family protein [Nitrospirae bacterium]|nr:YdcF family protein [Nitrospirota bacterium]
MKRYLTRKVVLVVLLIFVLDISVSTIYFFFIENKTHFPEKSADVGIILTGFIDSKNGIDDETRRRINHASKLYNNRLFVRFFCAGGARPHKNFYGAEMVKNELIAYGINKDIIYSERISNDTRSNLKEAFKMIENNGWRSVIIISSPLHLYRAQGLVPYSKNIEVSLSAYPYADSNPKISLITLWKHIHYEWAAFFSAALPQPIYAMIKKIIQS